MSLTFFYGTMNSGKSTHIIQEARNLRARGFDVIIVQSKINDRDEGVVSRTGSSVVQDFDFDKTTDIVCEIKEIISVNPEKKYLRVLIDEAQFLTKEQVDNLFIYSTKANLHVYCYGLKTDFTGTAFPGSKRLLELAELHQLDTVPCRCGNNARFNARFDTETGKLVTKGSQILTEHSNAKYEYDPICSECFIDLGGSFS